MNRSDRQIMLRKPSHPGNVIDSSRYGVNFILRAGILLQLFSSWRAAGQSHLPVDTHHRPGGRFAFGETCLAVS